MREVSKLILGKNTETNEEVLLNNGNLLILGGDHSRKHDIVTCPFLNQVIANKGQGVTIFDHTGKVTSVAYALAKKNRRKILYFNPTLYNVKFNPLRGNVEDVIANFIRFFRIQNPHTPEFYMSNATTLLTYAIKVLKRLYGDNTTLFTLQKFLSNVHGFSRKTIIKFNQLSPSDGTKKEEHDLISSWLSNEYLNEKSKTYEYSITVRSFLVELLSNQALAQIFNTNESGTFLELDFNQHLQNKEVVIIHTDETKLSTTACSQLQTLIALHFQNVVFRQVKPVNHLLYIQNLYCIKPILDELFQFGTNRCLRIVAEADNGVLFEHINREYKNTSLIANFPNIILMQGTMINDQFRDQIFPNNLSNTNNVPVTVKDKCEFYYQVLDPNANAYQHTGFAFGIPLSVEETAFLQKRIKRYNKEFQHQLNLLQLSQAQ
ncbi:TraG/TraD [Brevibacillus sp. NPDC058079]|uniref:TraG/TraD n=1 Tax=Brevibacillus sp. NPDC058079 TaxID=3346330 RepID=UPI0036E2FC4E